MTLAPLALADILGDRFAYSSGYHGIAILLTGGLLLTAASMFAFIASARRLSGLPADARGRRPRPSVLTRALLPPASSGRPADGRFARQSLESPEAEGEKGRIAGERVRARTVDELLDRFVDSGLGDPRIVRSASALKAVRVSRCRSCEASPAGSPKGICEFERAYLAAAFGTLLGKPARAAETRCRARGDASCEFEVTY